MIRGHLLLAVALAAVLGCRGGSAQEVEVDLEVLVDQCRHDLAEVEGVDDGEVQVTRVEAVVWSDGSLGYPEPGMDYIQMLIPGYRVTLQVGGRTYEYHTDQGRRIVWRAEGGKAPAQVIGPVELPGTTIPSEPSGVGVLYLRPLPDEPNGNGALMLLAPGAAEPTTVLERCLAFAVSDEGHVLAKVRTSRSTHDLLLAPAAGEPRMVAQAFDFAALTFSRTDSRYALLVRRAAGQPWVVHVGAPEDDAPKPLDWAPPVQPGDRTRVSLAGDTLLLVVPDGDDALHRNSVLDLRGQKVVADFRSPEAALTPLGP
ncbi:MAG: hypothetical protein FJX74_06095 [Armatimonadetes bacterium]|nr:hypothetical protein [Armatimonadota bacterium]